MLLSRRYLRGGNLAGWCWPPGSSRCSSVFPRHTSFARGKQETERDSRSIKSACVNICKVVDRPLFDRGQWCKNERVEKLPDSDQLSTRFLQIRLIELAHLKSDYFVIQSAFCLKRVSLLNAVRTRTTAKRNSSNHGESR